MIDKGMTEIGCMAHARRKFFNLHVANKSQLPTQRASEIEQLLPHQWIAD